MRPSVTVHAEHCVLSLRIGDCIQGMSAVSPGCVDVIVTSPPYNIGVRYGSSYDDTAPRHEYLNWIGRWAEAVQRVLADDGSLFLVVGSKPSDPWVPFDVAQVMREHFVLQNVIHWVKSVAVAPNHESRITNLESRVLGHYKPINSPRFLNQAHEYVFHFTKNGDVPLERIAIGVPYQDKSNVTRWKAAAWDLHCRGNVWFIPYETIQRRDRDRPHPATFPPRLAEMCIRLCGLDKVRLVLDPFMGIGNTAVACAQLGVDFLGFEIEEEYVRVAEERLRAASYE